MIDVENERPGRDAHEPDHGCHRGIAALERRRGARPGTRFDLVSPKGNQLQPETKLPFRTAADVAKTVPEKVDWLVPGFVAPGVVTEIDGKLKASGKTTWIAALLRAVLTGALFMGLQTKRAKAIWLTEERPQTFAETLKRAHLEDSTEIEVLHWHEVKGLPWSVLNLTPRRRYKRPRQRASL